MGLYEITRLPAIISIKWDGMTFKNEHEAMLDLNSVEKKVWQAPQMTQLNVKETKSGSIDADTEGSWWIFTWGPQS